MSSITPQIRFRVIEADDHIRSGPKHYRGFTLGVLGCCVVRGIIDQYISRLSERLRRYIGLLPLTRRWDPALDLLSEFQFEQATRSAGQLFEPVRIVIQ